MFLLSVQVEPSPANLLSPAGIAYHRAWLKNLFIPWQDVQGVGGPLEIESASGFPSTSPHALAVVVTQDFYERHIAPKPSFLAPPRFERMFQPKNAMMQVVLTSTGS